MKALVVIALAVAALAAASRPAAAKGCHEHSFVVGYQHCSQFGDWSRGQGVPAFQVELGWQREDYLARSFTLADGRSPQTHGVVSDGGTMRYLLGTGLVYGGLELDFGFLSTMPQFAGLPPYGATFGARGVVGVHASLWRLGYGVELAGGVRYTQLAYCQGKAECADVFGQTAGALDARAHVDVFLLPHVSVSVTYGHSLVAADDHTVMVMIGGHFRALDGMY